LGWEPLSVPRGTATKSLVEELSDRHDPLDWIDCCEEDQMKALAFTAMLLMAIFCQISCFRG
jgi:hypothetical protein